MTRYSELLCLLSLMTINLHATPVNHKRVPIAGTLNLPCTGSHYGDMTGKLNNTPIMHDTTLTMRAEICKIMCFGKSRLIQCSAVVWKHPY